MTIIDQTKSSQDATADLVLAQKTASGLQLGQWYTRCFQLRPKHLSNLIFQDSIGSAWTSASYRTTHLLPLLNQQRLEGDAYLAPYNGSAPELCLAHVVFTIHSFRSGGKSDASLKQPGSLWKGDPSERIEHGRWRQQNKPGAEPIVIRYTQHPILNRVALVLFCM